MDLSSTGEVKLGVMDPSSMSSCFPSSAVVVQERPVLTQETFHDVSEYVKPHRNRLARLAENVCSSCSPGKVLKQTFPICSWLSSYSWKDDLPCDVIAGVTVAIMQIPQGLAYALLANVPAAVGIYMAVFPVIPYILLGTSRHNSMGTFAVISLLVGRAVTTYAHNPAFTHPVTSLVNGTEVLEDVEYSEIEVGASLALVVALWQLLMWGLRMGAVCALLSDVLVNSFTCGASVHIFTSQVKALVGISTRRYSGPFQLIYTYVELVQKLVWSSPEARVTTYTALVISAVCIATLVFNIYVLKPRLARVTRVPFPCELLLVVAGVLASSSFALPENYGLKPIGYIPKGIPEPTVPYFNLIPYLVMDGFITAVVSYATLMSMALILARGENYEVDANQELLAMGAGNVVGSCFSCIAFAASLSRSIVAKGVGGRTQLTALVSGLIIVVTLLWIADFFEPLPRAVLAAIIIVALRSVLLQICDLPKFWKLSRADGMLWICVFLAVVVIDIDYGLLVGFLLSAGRVFMQGMKAYTCILGRVPNTDLYLDVERYKAAREEPGVKLVHYCGALNFATRQRLKDEVARLSGVSPQRELRRRRKRLEASLQEQSRQQLHINLIENGMKQAKDGKTNPAFVHDDHHSDGDSTSTTSANEKVFCIVLDVSAVTSLDPSAAELLRTLRDEYRDIGIEFIIAGCSGPVYEVLRRCGLLNDDEALCLYPSVHDAARQAMDTCLVRAPF